MHADKADKAVKGSDSRSDSRPVPAPEDAGERDLCTAAGARSPLIVKPPPPALPRQGPQLLNAPPGRAVRAAAAAAPAGSGFEPEDRCGRALGNLGAPEPRASEPRAPELRAPGP